MNSEASKTEVILVLALGVVCSAFTLSLSAQVQTETTTTSGQATREVTVEHGEVVLIRGNDLFVKMDDGTMRHFPNVSESARVKIGRAHV